MDVTDATFQTEVLARSVDTPVIVDLWAEWCGPCKSLTPILEKVIGEKGGSVVLAKVDVDQNPQIQQAFQVQSIPSVFAIVDQQVVDNFMGAQPEHVVREFIDKVVPSASPVDELVEAGDEASLRQALELEPDHEGAIAALATILIDGGNNDEALQYLARVPESDVTRPIAARARASEAAGDIDDVEARLTTLLPKVKDDDAARKEFVDLLEVLGPNHPNTGLWRKKLSTQLF
ncbi:MAG: tetratricopeptide repeat protein [Acidimicrobiales bacterium]|nr:tetratricopeptide repeat protein [Acidimicrobiales bacterium]